MKKKAIEKKKSTYYWSIFLAFLALSLFFVSNTILVQAQEYPITKEKKIKTDYVSNQENFHFSTADEGNNIIRNLFGQRKEITTTINIFDLDSKEAIKGIKPIISKNNAGDNINLNDIAKDSIDRLKGQGYKIEKVETFDLASLGYKEIPDMAAYNIPTNPNGTDVVNIYLKKVAKPIKTRAQEKGYTISFLYEGDLQTLRPPFTLRLDIGSTYNLRTASGGGELIQGYINELSKWYSLVGVVELGYGASQNWIDDSRFTAKDDGITEIRYMFGNKNDKKDITTTINFLDSDSKKAINGVTPVSSKNNAGATINLNDIARNPIAILRGQDYEVEKVESFDSASGSYKIISNPTAYNVPANSNGTDTVNYYFKKKKAEEVQIITQVSFVDNDGKSLGSPITFIKPEGTVVDLRNIAAIKAKLTGDLKEYTVLRAEDVYGGNNSIDITRFIIGSTQSVRLILQKKAPVEIATQVSFVDDAGKSLGTPITFTESEGTVVDLRNIAAIKAKLTGDLKEYTVLRAEDAYSGSNSIDMANFKIGSTQSVRLILQKKAPVEIATQVSFVDVVGKSLGTPITFTGTEGTVVDLRNIAAIKAKLTGDLKEYTVLRAEDALTGSKSIDMTSFKIGSTQSVRLILEKQAKSITTTINFLDSDSKEAIKGISTITSKNNAGNTINLNDIAKDTIATLNSQNYEVQKVEAFDLASVTFKEVPDPTAYKVPANSTGTDTVNYYFKKIEKQITTQVLFVDDAGKNLGDPITFTETDGTVVDLRNIAAIKAKLTGDLKEYTVLRAEDALTGSKSIDMTNFKIGSTQSVRLILQKKAPVEIATQVSFVDDAGKSLGDPITFTETDGTVVDLRNIAAIKAKLTGDLKEYTVLRAEDALTGSKSIDMANFKIGSTQSVRLILEKQAKSITTTINFLDSDSKEVIKGISTITSKNNAGNTINLNDIAKDTIATLNSQNYEVQKVEAFDLASVTFKEVPDPTAYKVPANSTGTDTVNYYFKKIEKQITTQVLFVDDAGKNLGDPITFTETDGTVVDLRNIAAIKAKLTGDLKEYTVLRAEDALTGSKSIDMTNFKIGSTQSVRLILQKKAPAKITTQVSFIDDAGKSLGDPITFTETDGTVVDLQNIAAIKAKLAELGKAYNVIGATDKKGKTITSYPKYTIGSTEDNTIQLILKKNTQKLTVQFKTTDNEELDPVVKPIVIEEVIGTEIDLSKNEQIKEALKTISNEHYQLAPEKQPEDKQTIGETPQTITYTFDGKLFIESAPSTMSFGKQKIEKGLHFIKVNNAEFDKPLVIWDSRKKSKNWKVTATLETPFTNVQDSAQTLPDDVLGYKKDDNNIVKFRQGDAEILAERTSEETKNEYTLSEEWKSGKTGFRVEIPTNEVKVAGGYQAKILWQVGNTP
ncbi:hypothetical protein [Enterococcus sp. AZ126]|uniref:hypothetical protein n=1 Tax=Enterococcus sp. AZ126 TaxID=2774635 RepID=UPI003F229923